MVLSPKVRSVVAGVLVANSAPHLATAVAGENQPKAETSVLRLKFFAEVL